MNPKLNKRSVSRKKTKGKFILERRTPQTSQILEINQEICNACEICEKICPQKAAVRLFPPSSEKGKLSRKGVIEIDADKCNFCGECVVLCPLNALSIKTNGKARIPVVESNVFPILIKKAQVDIAKCVSSCNLECQKSCPTESIKIEMDHQEAEKLPKIIGVVIDEQKCIYCKSCEVACPTGSIAITKPIEGIALLNQELCPRGCSICQDICPSKAIKPNEKGKPKIDDTLCVYCGACTTVCPEHAITIQRTRILHSNVKSNSWIEALMKLTSQKASINELISKSTKKRFDAAKSIC